MGFWGVTEIGLLFVSLRDIVGVVVAWNKSSTGDNNDDESTGRNIITFSFSFLWVGWMRRLTFGILLYKQYHSSTKYGYRLRFILQEVVDCGVHQLETNASCCTPLRRRHVMPCHQETHGFNRKKMLKRLLFRFGAHLYLGDLIVRKNTSLQLRKAAC